MATATAEPRTKTIAKVTNRMVGTLGSTIDEMWALREKKRVAEEVVKKIEVDIAIQEEILLARMDKEDTNKAEGKKASVSITSAVVANVQDWEAFHEYIRKNKFFHLLQKRVEPAYRELLTWAKGAGCRALHKAQAELRSLNVASKKDIMATTKPKAASNRNIYCGRCQEAFQRQYRLHPGGSESPGCQHERAYCSALW